MIGRLRRARMEAANRTRVGLAELHALSRRPLISVVMPTYETEPRHLREAIESVRRQRYPDWELCIADDGSSRPSVPRTLARYAGEDERIEVVLGERNEGISAATNAALALCRGEFVAFLDHDDVLTPDALLRVAQVLDTDPALDVVYSDSDKLTLHGTRADPFHKPDWSPTYALGAMYVGHLLVARRELVERVGGLDPAYDTIQDFELMLRLSEVTDRIHHIPEILYHWRAVPGSIAAGADQKHGVSELQAKAVTAHLERRGVGAVAVSHPQIPHRALLEPDANGIRARQAAERVSMVVVARSRPGAAERLLDSVFSVSEHPPAEVIVVTPDPAWHSEHPVHVVVDPGGGRARAAAANLGAANATGAWLLFASDTAEVVEPDWLSRLMVHAELPGVGAVGPLIVRPDGRTEAAGFAIGLDDPVMPMLAEVEAGDDGYYGALSCARDVSAVSGDFMLVRSEAFRELGGFEENYLSGFADFDLCQQLRAAGNTIVYAPRPRVVVHETPAGRREALDVVDRALYVDRWYDGLKRGDPYFNRNFAASDANFVTDR